MKAYVDSRWPNGTKRKDRSEPHSAAYTTGDEHRGRLQTFLKVIDAKTEIPPDVDEATQIVQKYINVRIKAGLKPNSVWNDQKVLSRFFTWVRKNGMRYPANPAASERLDLPPKVQRQPVDVTWKDLKATVEAARKTDVWPLVLLIYGAGIRPIGAMDTLRKDVILDNKPRVRVIEKSKFREIGMTQWAAKEFKAWLKVNPRRPQERIWQMSKDTAHRRLKRLREELGLDSRVTLNAIRGMFSTMMFEAGALPHEEAEHQGHSMLIAEKHYVRWKRLKDRGIMGKVARIQARLSGKPVQNRCKLIVPV